VQELQTFLYGVQDLLNRNRDDGRDGDGEGTAMVGSRIEVCGVTCVQGLVRDRNEPKLLGMPPHGRITSAI